MNWRIVLREYANFIPIVSIPPYTRPSLANDRLLIPNIEVFPRVPSHFAERQQNEFQLAMEKVLVHEIEEHS